jgi:hypothetical protein
VNWREQLSNTGLTRTRGAQVSVVAFGHREGKFMTRRERDREHVTNTGVGNLLTVTLDCFGI